MDSNTETLKGRLRKTRELNKRVNLTVYVERFIVPTAPMGALGTTLEDILVHFVMLIIMSKEPIISIKSKHPLQKDGVFGLVWLEDSGVVGYIRSGNKVDSWVLPLDHDFDHEVYGRVLSKISFKGSQFFSQYQHAVFDTMDKIQLDVKEQ